MLAQVGHTRVPALVVAGLAHELGAVLLVQMLAGELLIQLLFVKYFEWHVSSTTVRALGLILPVHNLKLMKLNCADRVRFEHTLAVHGRL